MTASRTDRRPLLSFIAAFLLSLPAAAQPILENPAEAEPPPEATGQPQSLTDLAGPPQVEPESAPPELRPPLDDTPGATITRAPVRVGDLGTVEGPVAGTLDESAGGLGSDLWEGSDRALAETILRRVPAATPSPSARLLLRSTMLTAAPPPAGRGQGPFNALRLIKLLETGLLADAADLARLIQSRDAETQILQAEAFLYAGRDEDACGDATAARLASAEPFWVELRAYCYAVVKDTAALDLTRAVMDQQGLAEKPFVDLLDAVVAGKPPAAPDLAAPSALQLRMLVRLNAPLPPSALDLGMPGALLVVSSAKTPKEVRLAAAERALRGGALAPEQLPQMLDLIAFRPADLTAAAAMARNEPVLLNALARLRAALNVEKRPDRRGELLQAALQIGEREHLLPQVAALFTDEIAALTPAENQRPWAPLMIRSLLLAGKPAAAGRWLDILDPVTAGATLHELRLAFALFAPGDPHGELADESLHVLSDSAAQEGEAPRAADAALAIGLFEATGRDIPDGVRGELDLLMAHEFPGRRPAPNTMERVETASLAGHRGAVALAVLDALGVEGAGDLPADIVVRLVRALRTAGLNEAARSVAREALLTHPGEI
jgi:hypothetical protein